MAHHASCCYNLEVNCSYGCIDCTCIADRSVYDLWKQSEHSGPDLTTREVFTKPLVVERLVCVAGKGSLGKRFTKNAETIISRNEEMDNTAVNSLQKAMESDENPSIPEFEASKKHVTFTTERNRITSCSK